MRTVRTLLGALALGGAGFAAGQSPERGAELYMRLPDGSRSCLSCHGAEPAANPNNLLRAANAPATLTRVMNTVSAMGFLSSRLSESDRADITAFLGSVAAQGAAGVPLAISPHTLESGSVPAGGRGSPQRVRIANRAAQPVPLGAITASAGLVAGHDCPAVLPAGAACEVTTRLQAGGAGWRTASLRIESPALPRAFVAGASALGSTEPVSTLSWDGGDEVRLATAGGAVVRRAVVLRNPGPMPALVEAQLLLGPQAAAFRLEGGCAGGTMLQAGTSCSLTLAFQPGQLAQAEALLRVRTDQGHPALLRVAGENTPAAAVPEPVAAAPSGGGGCSVRPPGQGLVDPLLALLAAAAALALRRRRGRQRPPAITSATAPTSAAAA